ncbi:MAG: rod shape-determining protein MreC [Acidaminococcaceae bacterium]
MSKKTVLAVLMAAIIVLLMVLAIQGRARFPFLNRAIVAVVTPLNEAVAGVAQSASSTRGFFAALTTMQTENAQLKKDTEELRYANLRMAEIFAENNRLRVLLAYKNEAKNLELLTVKVVGRDFGDLKESLLINAGSEQGIKEEMPVVTADGLVGIVAAVYPTAARVQLVTSPFCKVGGIVLRSASRAVGVVNGIAGQDADLEMNNMSRDANIVAGDVVVTSGLGGRHPRGLVIGSVSKIELDKGGLLMVAEIIPSVDFSHLEEVMVVKNYHNYAHEVQGKETENKKQNGGMAQ